MVRFIRHLFFTLLLSISVTATTEDSNSFSLLVYNVENLFDLDGIALFDEYSQDENGHEHPYGPERFLTKINNHAEVIASYDKGQGVDIVAIQEFEADFSQDPEFDLSAMLKQYEQLSVEEMLLGELDDFEMRLPPEFFLLKRLAELGLYGYRFVTPEHEASWIDRSIAHRCVFLSRFPVVEQHQHRIERGRDILEVVFDINGNEFTIYNNHWKSGASSPKSELIRIQNAEVLRSLIDVRLAENPAADIVLVGDFNSHHNQDIRMSDVEVTAINGVLKSQSSELALKTGAADLYNLWYELPQQERGSDVWNGEWGTLMQIIVTPGLLDGKGIAYRDQSFGVLKIADLNFEEKSGTPIQWVNLGTGKGCSDHMPIFAEFQFETDQPLPVPSNDKLGSEVETKHIPIMLNMSLKNRLIKHDPASLNSMTEEELLHEIGELYQVKGTRSKRGLRIAGKEYSLYSPDFRVRDQLKGLVVGDTLEFVGEFGIFRGSLQFIIQDYTWIK